MAENFQSHINNQIYTLVTIPVLSAPFTDPDDCRDDAPDNALLLWSPEAGTYQWLRLDVPYAQRKDLRPLVNEIQQIADACVLEYRVSGQWHRWVD